MEYNKYLTVKKYYIVKQTRLSEEGENKNLPFIRKIYVRKFNKIGILIHYLAYNKVKKRKQRYLPLKQK